jgi:hypothetical protein
MIDTSAFALPKPGHAIGRVVLTQSQYMRRKRELWIAQGRACANCDAPIDSLLDAALHHLNGRGLGGGKRDDRFASLICGGCHQQEHV